MNNVLQFPCARPEPVGHLVVTVTADHSGRYYELIAQPGACSLDELALMFRLLADRLELDEVHKVEIDRSML